MKQPFLPNQVNVLPQGTQKISIIGCGGTGKSTLARQLGQITGLPVVHLDRIFWKPNWQSISREEMNHRIQEQIANPAWIIDGNYSITMPGRLEASDVVIFLDFPRGIALYNVLKRRLVYHNRSRLDMADGCKEKIDGEFLKWIWNFNKTHRSRYYQTLAVSGKPVVILESHRQVKRFVDSLKSLNMKREINPHTA
ncbi:MAG: hypothetical protein WBI14_02975 [Anaerolineaceae bacterium]